MKLFTYLKNVRGELRHVVWPSRKQALIHTGLVILISVITGFIIVGLDYVFTGVVERIVNGG
jgi:preprotein translocase SecE subunit